MVTPKAPKIFLSHAAADRPLVEAFETLLAKSLNITSEDIFCSSLEGQGVSKGGNFVEEIRAKAVEAEGVVALISPSYLDSPFCMAELGAAWALETKKLPIIVPPNSFEAMQATLLGIVGVKIDDEDALLQGFEDFSKGIDTHTPKAAVRSRAMREFLRSWDELKSSISPSTKVPYETHKMIIEERDDALQERDNAEKLLSEAEQKIAALQQVKDATAVQDIEAEFDNSDWEEKLESELSEIKELQHELGGREIVRLLILECLGKETRPDFYEYREEAVRAVELDVYDAEGEKWNFSHPEVEALSRCVEKIQDIFGEFPQAAEELRSRGKKANPDYIAYWEENI